MEEFLVVVIQFLFEFLFDVLLNIPFDWPSKNRKLPEPEAIAGICFAWFLGAAGLGYVSLWVFGHTLIASPGLRIANLALAPLVSAHLSKTIAARRAKENANIIPRNHYWKAFWFTLGYTAVRFAYASHA